MASSPSLAASLENAASRSRLFTSVASPPPNSRYDTRTASATDSSASGHQATLLTTPRQPLRFNVARRATTTTTSKPNASTPQPDHVGTLIIRPPIRSL